MRVLHVIGMMDCGGAETMIMNLYRFIDRSKVQFDFLVHENKECDYDVEIRQLGGNIYNVPRFNGMNYFLYKKKCRDFFSRTRYPIVHGHIGSSAAIYLSEANRAGCFTIAHSHSQNYISGLQGLAFKALSYPTRNIADYFFGCSYEAGKDRYGTRIVESEVFSILNNGIDTNSYQFDSNVRQSVRLELGLKNDIPVFGHVGRLASVKNHEFLLRTFKEIKLEIPDSVLLIVGKGELEKELKSLSEKLGLSDSVKFLGMREDVSRILQAMDVYIFPSKKEGLAMAVIEAQAAGLPCLVSTGVPKAAMILKSSEYLTLECGAKEWAKKALRLYSEKDKIAREAGAGIVRNRGFDIKKTAAWMENFYISHAPTIC